MKNDVGYFGNSVFNINCIIAKSSLVMWVLSILMSKVKNPLTIL